MARQAATDREVSMSSPRRRVPLGARVPRPCSTLIRRLLAPLAAGLALAAQAQAADAGSAAADSAAAVPGPRAAALDSTSALAGLPVVAIEITGNEYTKTYIIERELGNRVGESFRPAELASSRQRLLALSIFTRVDVAAYRRENGVVVKVAVDEAFPFLPLPALSISDENGVSVGASVRGNNLFRRNVTGEIEVLVGGLQSTEIRLRDPWLFGYRGAVLFEYFNRQRQNKVVGFYENAREIFLRAGRGLGSHGRVGAGFGYQRIRSDTDGKTLSNNNIDDVFTVSAFAGVDTRDRTAATSNGWWNEFVIERTGLVGDSRFWRLIYDLRRYNRLGRTHTLALFGLVTETTGHLGSEVAPWQTFHLGGSNTVRGWEIGSRSGQSQIIATIEYRWAFRELRPTRLPFGLRYDVGLHLVAFADVGWAWNRGDVLRWKDAIDGYGVGLRIDSPVLSMLRLDFAVGEPGVGVRVHIASLEKAEMARMRVR
jgi:outer membrane protein assembly factor BamA